MEYKDYTATEDNFMDIISEYGVCVIPHIFTESECISLRDNIWCDLKTISGGTFDVLDTSTWSNYYDIINPIHNMIINKYGIGHSQAVWNIRQDLRIGNIFSKIWNVPKENLLSSFDSVSCYLPPEITGIGFYDKKNEWLHTDQSPNKKGFHCIQGMVNLYDTEEGDATLCVLEGSNKLHENFFKFINYNSDDDWYKLKPGQRDFFANCKEVCIKAPIGSLILFDSRTIHQGISAQKGRMRANFRMVIYTCLMPKSYYTEEQIRMRKKYFLEKRMTNHWGTEVFEQGDKMLETTPLLTEYGNELV